MEQSRSNKIVDEMMKLDLFSQWLAIERLEEREGFCTLRMTVRKEMCNGFHIAHGGIAYSLADTALAFASNSRGKKAVSLETSISHHRPLKAGDVITAATEEISVSNHIGIYLVRLQREDGVSVALFKGTVYIRDELWDV